MSRAIRIVITVILACICQTDLVKYIRIATIAPDMLTVFLVLLTGYTGAYGGFCAGLPFIFLRNLLKWRISGASGTRI